MLTTSPPHHDPGLKKSGWSQMLKKLATKVEFRLEDGDHWLTCLHLSCRQAKTFLHQSSLQNKTGRKSRTNTRVWKGEQRVWVHGNLHASTSKDWHWTERRWKTNLMCTQSHLLLRDQPLDPSTEQPCSDIQETPSQWPWPYFYIFFSILPPQLPFSLSALTFASKFCIWW